MIERPENGSLIISLVQAGRERNLDRGLTEPLQKALARLEKNAQPAGTTVERQQDRTIVTLVTKLPPGLPVCLWQANVPKRASKMNNKPEQTV